MLIINYMNKSLVELIKNKLPPADVLDFGCGEGALSERMKDIGYKVISTDINDESFKASTEFIKMDFNNFQQMKEFANCYRNKFDIVVSVEIIEHLENIDLYFDTIKEVLKPNGILILSTPNISSFISRLYFLYNGIPMQFDENSLTSSGHINPITYLELKTLLEKRNFKILDIQPGGNLPLLWFTGPKYWIFHTIAFILSVFMRGKHKRGWCLITVAKELKDD